MCNHLVLLFPLLFIGVFQKIHSSSVDYSKDAEQREPKAGLSPP